MNEPIAKATSEFPLQQPGIRKVFVNRLETEVAIGVWSTRDREIAYQPISISIELDVLDETAVTGDSLIEVVCYEKLIRQVQVLCREGNFITFLELAECTAQLCLNDRRVLSVDLSIRKNPAVDTKYPIGVQLQRSNPTCSERQSPEFAST